MAPNLKTLGLALVAIFAFSAVAATAASAQGKLTSDGPVEVDFIEPGGSVTGLTAFGGKIECPGSIITGYKTSTPAQTAEEGLPELVPSGSTSVTLIPDYVQANCKAIEGGTTHKATVTMNGCDYDFRIGGTVLSSSFYNTVTDVVCPSGKDIQIEVYGFAASELGGVACTVTVKPQNGLTGPTIQNNLLNDDLSIGGTFTNVSASRSGFGCATEETKGGSIDFNMTAQGVTAVGTFTGLTVTDS